MHEEIHQKKSCNYSISPQVSVDLTRKSCSPSREIFISGFKSRPMEKVKIHSSILTTHLDYMYALISRYMCTRLKKVISN
ncbi:hypothetical protein VIGAN_02207500 [Vigna angularis var. angularis]|uniref:Uncharacterized protein n=1 Tax=Vigna angularis var. angularis TaxID=157739 RepID=A0A0S3RFN1_PHAAN|nr:hypothetical protein VIGAN_02207500 [Vigna angularis var. angularis]